MHESLQLCSRILAHFLQATSAFEPDKPHKWQSKSTKVVSVSCWYAHQGDVELDELREMFWEILGDLRSCLLVEASTHHAQIFIQPGSGELFSVLCVHHTCKSLLLYFRLFFSYSSTLAILLLYSLCFYFIYYLVYLFYYHTIYH